VALGEGLGLALGEILTITLGVKLALALGEALALALTIGEGLTDGLGEPDFLEFSALAETKENAINKAKTKVAKKIVFFICFYPVKYPDLSGSRLAGFNRVNLLYTNYTLY
jgi:hypothetical protein